jgi:hypothetical protein
MQAAVFKLPMAPAAACGGKSTPPMASALHLWPQRLADEWETTQAPAGHQQGVVMPSNFRRENARFIFASL